MEKWIVFGLFGIFLIAVAAMLYTGGPGPGRPSSGIVTSIVSDRTPVLEEIGYKVSSTPLAPRAIYFAGEETSDSSESLELTVYNQDFGLVKDRRKIAMAEGLNSLEFRDVAKEIDATSVLLTSDKRADIIEQNYQYDLISESKLLEKYLNKNVSVETEKSTYRGELLSYDPIVLDTGNGIVSISDAKNVVFPALPEGLASKPALVWKLDAEAGEHNVQLSYLTGGITWSADYVANVNADDTRLDMSGWITVDNNAGMTFGDAKLVLIAGQVNKVTGGRAYYDTGYAYASMAETAAPSAKAAVTEQAFYEYHTYTLNVPTTVRDNEQKQVRLLDKSDVPVTKEYVFDSEQRYYYYGSSSDSTKVKVMLNLRNSDPLGVPLPAGTVRLYKTDASGQQQFIGEDSIEHTAKDEDIRLFTGYAFDIVGERTQEDYQYISSSMTKYTYEVVLRNHKDTPVTVTVIEHLYGSWVITANSMNYEKTDANTIEFKPTVPANGNVTITYTYLQSW